MNKKIFLIGLTLFPCLLLAQSKEIKLGKIDFPRAFIHAGQEFPQGSYDVVLTEKDTLPIFTVYNSKQELLFEERLISKAYSGIKKVSPFRVKKEFLKGEEYFRIKVIQPEQWLMGYFLVKK